MSGDRTVEHVTCLGCGCTCDDIAVRVEGGRIVEAAHACPIGRAWFGDGSVPNRVLRDGAPADIDSALATAADVLTGGPVLVCLAPGLSVDAQREAVALADHLGAAVDGLTSAAAATGILAAQRRGRAAATLGEVRNRGDVLVFWGVDPMQRYPRYFPRFVDASGTHIPQGRAGRSVVSISVGADRGPEAADLSLSLDADDEIAALSVMRAVVAGQPFGELPPALRAVADLGARLAQASYAILVHDAEVGDPNRSAHRTEGLIALAQTLNGPTRAAVSSLRGGGNRAGAEAVLTWQTGFPFAVDFSRGYPSYQPHQRPTTLLATRGYAAVLVAGAAAELPEPLGRELGRVSSVVVGPRASEAPFAPRIAIDTGIAGIHDGGTAYRMDDVPLPLRPSLDTPRAAATTIRALAERLMARPPGGRQ